MEEEYHGWFSSQQAKNVLRIKNSDNKKKCPYKIYLNKDNEEVRVTSISLTKDHGCNFSDIEYCGIVTKYLRSEN